MTSMQFVLTVLVSVFVSVTIACIMDNERR